MNFKPLIDPVNDLLGSYSPPPDKFVPGETVVQYAGPIYDKDEMQAGMEAMLNGWMGLAENGIKFERSFPKRLGKDFGLLTNSGSSANLLALAALKSKSTPDRLQDGDEVITTACGFSTTLNPILQNGLVPVFVDVEPGSYTIDLDQLENALSDRTRAVFFAHTLGNITDMDRIVSFCKVHNLRLIEDCCDALGGKFNDKPVGGFGDFSTVSFYASHHICLGEGGFVGCKDKGAFDILRSLRDWGRACYCYGKGAMLENGTCGVRHSNWLDGIKSPVDHKYVYSEIGYNLKPVELQAAIGLQQLKKLDGFISARRENFREHFEFFKRYEEFFILPVTHPKADPSWFAFPLTVKLSAPFTKAQFVRYLESHKIQTRDLFAGNLLRHPAYRDIPHRVAGPLTVSDAVITGTFFIGVYPGLKRPMREYIYEVASKFLDMYK